jgi:hypothetical protein
LPSPSSCPNVSSGVIGRHHPVAVKPPPGSTGNDEEPERYAREQQVALQEEQVKLARQQKNAQDAHNAKIEAIVKKEAAAARSQREFEKDVLWLEKSDTEERVNYISKKIGDDFKSESINTILTKSFNSDEWKKQNLELVEVLNKLNNTDKDWFKNKSDLESNEKLLTKSQSLEKETGPNWKRFALVIIAPFMAFGVSWCVQKEGDLKTEDQFGFTVFLLAIFLGVASINCYVGYKKLVSLRKRISKAIQRIEEEKPLVEAAAKKRQSSKSVAKNIYDIWSEAAIKIITENHMKYAIGDGPRDLFKDKFVSWQLNLPSNCRVSFESVREVFLKEFIANNMIDVQNGLHDFVKSKNLTFNQLDEVERLSDMLKLIGKE